MRDNKIFLKGLKKLNIDLSREQLQQFEDYYDLLIEWNKVMNLTAITEYEEVITKHFLDSLSIIKFFNVSEETLVSEERLNSKETLISKEALDLKETLVSEERLDLKEKLDSNEISDLKYSLVTKEPTDFKEVFVSRETSAANKVFASNEASVSRETLKKYFFGKKIIDLGTGAGFPGIPLKIVFPECEMVLMDSLNKRVNFLDEVIRRLKLDNVKAIHGRAEEMGRKDEFREQYDYCVSRAVARLTTLSEYCIPFIKKQGYFISYKSGNVDEEFAEAEYAIKQLGAKCERKITFKLPDTDMERSLIVIKKHIETPKKYPRAGGKPSNSPLIYCKK